LLFHFVCGVASRLIAASNDVDRGSQSGRSGCATHEIDNGLDCIEKHAAASSPKMGKETSLNRIVLRAVRRIVGHANRQPDRIAQTLQVVFENVLAGRIATAAVAGQQNRSCIAVALLSDPIPVPPKTVTGELGGVA